MSTKGQLLLTWLHSAWSGQALLQRLAVAALAVLACRPLVSPGWASGGSVTDAATTFVELTMVALLVSMLARGSEVSPANHHTENARDEELARLLAQNADLRRQIDESQRRSVEIHDMALRRVGVELHDGPAQLISLALLRLDCLRPDAAVPSDVALSEFERIRGALQEALAEIRSMSAGLTLPELSGVSPADVLRLAVRNHERRTATSVVCDVDGLPQNVPGPIKSCLYRFVQEALNNAYRHAGGRGQTVRGQHSGNTIEIEVSDAGPGFEPDGKIGGGRLGLLGMRERVALLGGTLEIYARPGAGTRLTTRFKLAEHGAN